MCCPNAGTHPLPSKAERRVSLWHADEATSAVPQHGFILSLLLSRSPCLIDCKCLEGGKGINRWSSWCSFAQQNNFWVNSQWVKVVPPLHSSISLFTLDLHLLIKSSSGCRSFFCYTFLQHAGVLLITRRCFLCADCLNAFWPSCGCTEKAVCTQDLAGTLPCSQSLCLRPGSRVTSWTHWEEVGIVLVPFLKGL